MATSGVRALNWCECKIDMSVTLVRALHYVMRTSDSSSVSLVIFMEMSIIMLSFIKL